MNYFWKMKNFSSILLVILALCGQNELRAQYYYKDIVGSHESNELVRNYLNNKVKKVVLVSYDADGTRNNDLVVNQEFFAKAQKMLTTTGTGTSVSWLTSYFNEQGLVIKTVDSSITLVTLSTYQYNADHLLTSLYTRSADTSGHFVQTEEHHWEYLGSKPVKMIKVKNGKPTELVLFKLDEKGHVIEEQSTVNGRGGEPVQYFYDEEGRLTDVVRYNAKAKKLLPEYLFEYSPSNQVIQKITVPSNSSNYLIWRYQYDNKGLKVREAIFDKQKQLNGKIEYQYVFGE